MPGLALFNSPISNWFCFGTFVFIAVPFAIYMLVRTVKLLAEKPAQPPIAPPGATPPTQRPASGPPSQA